MVLVAVQNATLNIFLEPKVVKMDYVHISGSKGLNFMIQYLFHPTHEAAVSFCQVIAWGLHKSIHVQTTVPKHGCYPIRKWSRAFSFHLPYRATDILICCSVFLVQHKDSTAMEAKIMSSTSFLSPRVVHDDVPIVGTSAPLHTADIANEQKHDYTKSLGRHFQQHTLHDFD